MKTTTPKKRPKPLEIRPIEEAAPWVLISKAADDSGLTELIIRNAAIKLRKFGNADYLRPQDLNAWILGDDPGRPAVADKPQ